MACVHVSCCWVNGRTCACGSVTEGGVAEQVELTDAQRAFGAEGRGTKRAPRKHGVAGRGTKRAPHGAGAHETGPRRARKYSGPLRALRSPRLHPCRPTKSRASARPNRNERHQCLILSRLAVGPHARKRGRRPARPQPRCRRARPSQCRRATPALMVPHRCSRTWSPPARSTCPSPSAASLRFNSVAPPRDLPTQLSAQLWGRGSGTWRGLGWGGG